MLLRRMRVRGALGLTPRVRVERWGGVALLVLMGSSSGCRSDVNQNPPDEMLRDTLGLTEEDRVFRIEVSAAESRELALPQVVRIAPGSWVEFFVADHRIHAIGFELSRLTSGQADFLTGTGQDASPPLVALGSRFVVSFKDAPPGRYPFVLEGSGSPGRGTIVVEPERAN